MADFPSRVELQPDGSYLPNGKAMPAFGGTALEAYLSKLLMEQRITNIYLQQITQLLMGLNAATPGPLPIADDASVVRQDPTFLAT